MKNDLRKDLHSLLKQWRKPEVTARRNSLDLFKECEHHNKGERIRVIQKGLKLKRNMRRNIKKYDQGWESSCHSLRHTKKYGQGNFIEDVVRDKQVLTRPTGKISGAPDSYVTLMLTLAGCSCSHTTDTTEILLFLIISPFRISKKVTHKHFSWNTCAISNTWYSEQPHHGVLLLSKFNLISRAEGSQ